jgi:protein-L-isoaspartate(D-aspartate) O-methyltransferase
MSHPVHVRWLIALGWLLGACALQAACDRDRTERDYQLQREQLVRESMEHRDIHSQRVLAAMRKVPRHLFVPLPARGAAYADRPLEIGHGQTISQPYIVAYMTQAVAPKPQDRCLEIGTGSGYQAAVLAEVCKQVFSIEYIPELADSAKRNLKAAGYSPDRVVVFTGDGYRGWPEEAPFEVIVVTAAPDRVPQPLLDQLAVGGRLVIPVGPQDDAQWLELWRRVKAGDGPGALVSDRLTAVRFVPFLGDGVWGK